MTLSVKQINQISKELAVLEKKTSPTAADKQRITGLREALDIVIDPQVARRIVGQRFRIGLSTAYIRRAFSKK